MQGRSNSQDARWFLARGYKGIQLILAREAEGGVWGSWHSPVTVRKQRDVSIVSLLAFSLFLFHSVQDPRPGNSAMHIRDRSSLLLLNLSRNTLTRHIQSYIPPGDYMSSQADNEVISGDIQVSLHRGAYSLHRGLCTNRTDFRYLLLVWYVLPSRYSQWLWPLPSESL